MSFLLIQSVHSVMSLIAMVTEFDLHYYTEVQDLSYLLDHVTDDPFLAQHKKLTEALIGVIQDYSLVNYMTLNVEVCLC